jgi:hypothetical protein
VDVGPLFVQFQPGNLQTGEMAIVPVLACLASFLDDAQHRMLARLEHPADGIDGHPLAQCSEDQRSLRGWDALVGHGLSCNANHSTVNEIL